MRARMKFSKDLLELRDKENKLVRMKRYEEAEKVKMKADLLEEFERNKLEAEVSLFSLFFLLSLKHLSHLNLNLCLFLGIDVSRSLEERSQAASLAIVSFGSVVEAYLARS